MAREGLFLIGRALFAFSNELLPDPCLDDRITLCVFLSSDGSVIAERRAERRGYREDEGLICKAVICYGCHLAQKAIYAKAITRAYLRCLDSLAPEIRQRYVIGCLIYPVYCNQSVPFLYSLRDSRS